MRPYFLTGYKNKNVSFQSLLFFLSRHVSIVKGYSRSYFGVVFYIFTVLKTADAENKKNKIETCTIAAMHVLRGMGDGRVQTKKSQWKRPARDMDNSIQA